MKLTYNNNYLKRNLKRRGGQSSTTARQAPLHLFNTHTHTHTLLLILPQQFFIFCYGFAYRRYRLEAGRKPRRSTPLLIRFYIPHSSPFYSRGDKFIPVMEVLDEDDVQSRPHQQHQSPPSPYPSKKDTNSVTQRSTWLTFLFFLFSLIVVFSDFCWHVVYSRWVFPDCLLSFTFGNIINKDSCIFLYAGCRRSWWLSWYVCVH